MSRQAIMDVARGEVGYITQTPDSTKFNLWFGLNPAEWCGIFCSWCYNQAGHPLGPIDFQKGFAGLYFALDYWKKKVNPDNSVGRLTTTPNQADLVIYSWRENGLPDHVGLFSKSIDANTIESIEGNTSNGVNIRQRNIGLVLCYVNPLLLPATP
jgi:CHAP domain